MNDAEIILKMIEEIGSASQGTYEIQQRLNEIDARMECWMLRRNFVMSYYERGHLRYKYDTPDGLKIGGMIIKYTRSRDALKSIRPKGWYIGGIFDETSIGQFDTGYNFVLRNGLAEEVECQHFRSYRHATEELAELHAIIQAIEYERKNEKNKINQ